MLRPEPNLRESTTRGRLLRLRCFESRVGFTRFSQRIGINNDIDPNALGINTGPLGASASNKENFGVPAFYYLGYFGNTSYSLVGGIGGYPIVTRPDSSTYDWQEHFTKIKGNHTLKIGGQYQNAYTQTRRDRARSNFYFYYYGFANCAAGGQCPAGLADASQSDHVAALNELLLGLTEGAGRSFGVTNRRISQKSVGLYVQDSWKLKPNFTLEMGVRGMSRALWVRLRIKEQISCPMTLRQTRTDSLASIKSRFTRWTRTTSDRDLGWRGIF